MGMSSIVKLLLIIWLVIASLTLPALAEDWFPNPNAGRLFFAPTGKTPAKNQNHIYVSDLVFYNGRISFDNGFSCGGGIFPVLASVFYVAPQMRLFENDNFAWAVGGLLIGSGRWGKLGAAGLYTVTTFSYKNLSLTGGVGYLDPVSSLSPFQVVGGELRILEWLSLVSENWLTVTQFRMPISINGVRFFGENFSCELGGIPEKLATTNQILPCINFVYNF